MMDAQPLSFKIKSQKGLILKEFHLNPLHWFTVAHFCGQADHCFVGYKASSRIGELQKDGYLVSRWSQLKTALGGRLKEYHLAPEYRLDFEDDKIKIEAKPIDQPRQEPLFNITRLA